MDNTQIRHSLCGNATGFYRISEVETLMELARADEREKMQGVDVWVSWGKADYRPFMSKYEDFPIGKRDIISCWTSESIFNVSEGQSKKFIIMEATND